MRDQVSRALSEEADRHLVSLTSEAVNRLTVFVAELSRWAGRHRLVGRGEEMEIVRVHVSDSLAWLRGLELLSGQSLADALVLDVGTGAGLPGLALCCARPEVRVALNEVAQKKLAFLYAIIHKLGVECQVLGVRAEELARDGERFDHVVARGVRPPMSWFALGRQLARRGGTVWILASDRQQVPEERPALEYCYRLTDGRRRRVLAYRNH